MLWIHRLSGLAAVLALMVIVLGAYVRLSDAGLGCPDWPGCYGKILVPESAESIETANAAWPERPVEVGKAWKEMIHRYLASLLGLLIVAIAVVAWRQRDRHDLGVLPYALVGLVVFQGMLGMWTVTLLVKPLIVLLHLFGGLATLSLLWWMWMATRPQAPVAAQSFRLAARVGLMVLLLQIFLGGWTSTNYAALSCPDFPTCQTQWWPTMDFADAFTLWRGLGVDYEGGVLANASRVAIHVSHRIGAIITVVALLAVAIVGWRAGRQSPYSQRMASWLVLVMAVQVGLGISNVVFHLPLWVATAHNGVAALLVLLLLTIIYRRPSIGIGIAV